MSTEGIEMARTGGGSARQARSRAVREHLVRILALAVLIGAGFLLPGPGGTGAVFADQAVESANSVTTIGTYAQRVKALGPIGYYQLAEASNDSYGEIATGTVAADSSGNGNNGTYIAGDLYWSSTNTAYTSGNGYQYMIINVPSTYTIQAGDRFEYDLETVLSSDRQAIDFQTTTGTALRNSGLTDQNGVTADSSGTTAANFTPAMWYHRVITIPAGNALVGQTIQQVMLVNEVDGSTTQNAHFANIRITTSDGTVKKSFWSAGDPLPSLSLAYASPSQGANTINPGSLWGQADASALLPYDGRPAAARFGGDSTGVSVPSAALDMASRSAFSIELWVRSNAFRAALPGSALVCRQRDTGPGVPQGLEQYCIDHFNNAVRFFVRDASGNAVVTTGPNLNDNQWHHVVGVYNNGAMSLYVDGAQVATATDSNGLLAMPAGTVTRFMTRPGTFAPNNLGPAGTWGNLADVAIYPFALTTAQIQDHYIHH